MNVKHLSLLILSAASFCASCSGKSDDNIFLDKVNEALAQVGVSNKVTCHDAINAVSAIDPNLNPAAYSFADKERTFAYDVDTQQFIILKNDELLYAPNGYEMLYSLSVFKFTDVYTANTNYSQYLTDAYPGSETLVIKTGLDMGDHHDIHNIYYENNGEAKRIVLRTSCDYLNINAPKDEVLHYNISNNVFVTAANVYHECGTSAYTKASSGEIRFEPASSTDMFEIPDDCRLFVSTKTHKDAMVFAAIDADEVPATAHLHVTPVYEYTDLKGGVFYRLANNITFPADTQWAPSGDVCLDLNGKRLSFTANYHETESKSPIYDSAMDVRVGILIDSTNKDSDANCYILDSQSQLFESSGIYTTDCSILLRGTAEHQANLYMNGGKVTALRDIYGDPALIAAGKRDTAKFEDGFKSNLVMYGGKVKIKRKTEDSHPDAGLKCLQPRGAGAYVRMVYGNLESDGFCISGMGQMTADKSVGMYGGTKIEIVGGTFKSGLGNDEPSGDKSYPVLFFPQSGTVDITGGAFYGSSCITAKSGTVNVHGGTYVASGEYPEAGGDDGGKSGFVADGSVICIDAVDHGTYVGGANVKVDGNVNMISKNAYIAHIRQYPNEEPINPASVSITGGTFTYHLDKCKTFDPVKDPISINGGTWVKA